MDRRELLQRALRLHGISNEARLESHVRGCDLSYPVTEEVLHAGDTVAVWVRTGGVPGKYGAPEGQYPERLGIIMDDRHLEVYRVNQAFTVVRCTAAIFPLGIVEGVGGMGGGTQYLLPPGWMNSAERIL